MFFLFLEVGTSKPIDKENQQGTDYQLHLRALTKKSDNVKRSEAGTSAPFVFEHPKNKKTIFA